MGFWDYIRIGIGVKRKPLSNLRHYLAARRRSLALVLSPPYAGSIPFRGTIYTFPFFSLLVSYLSFFDLMIVIATDGTQARKSKYFVLEHMIGTAIRSAGVQLG